MSHTMMLLKLMSDDSLYTARQMGKRLGLTELQVYRAMHVLRKHKSMRADDQPYRITEAGKEWLAQREAVAQRVAMNKQKKTKAQPVDTSLPVYHDDEEPEPPFEHRIVPAPAVSDEVVSAALQGRHSLHAVWGAK